MRAFILLALLFSSRLFAADLKEVLTCATTEPAFSYTLDVNEGSLIYFNSYASMEAIELSSNAIFREVNEIKDKYGYIYPGSTYEVVDKLTGREFIKLTYNNQGSDGMTDTLYPFSAKLFFNDTEFFGACSTKLMPAQDVLTSIDLLKQK